MTEQKSPYHFTQRNDYGQFTSKNYGEKRLRSMKLSDHAWDVLEEMASLQGVSRTDIIEEFVRQPRDEKKVSKSEIVKQALQTFIEFKKQSFPKHLIQQGKTFNTDTRSWDALNDFLAFIENAPTL